jgi:Fe-S-cluster containining protein
MQVNNDRGACCCGEPGIVYFSQAEFERLVDFLGKTRGLTREAIVRDYMRPWEDSYTARDDFEDGHCVFYDKGCIVYGVRPSQCRDFPFWRQNLRNAAAWRDCAKSCPGMDQGRLWTADEICAIAQKSRI